MFDGNTALHIAAYYGNLDIVNRLLEKFCELKSCHGNINAKNSEGHTPLYFAVLTKYEISECQKEKCIQILINAGADIDAKDNLKRSLRSSKLIQNYVRSQRNKKEQNSPTMF
jgi:ankyrin repeat protein